MQNIGFMHQALYIVFVGRSIQQSLFEYRKLTKIILLFTPEKQAKIIDHLNSKQMLTRTILLLMPFADFTNPI